MKKLLLILGVCALGFTVFMFITHIGVIKAAVKGEEIPEAPEGCPACKKSRDWA